MKIVKSVFVGNYKICFCIFYMNLYILGIQQNNFAEAIIMDVCIL